MNIEILGLLISGLVFLVLGGELLVRGASQLASAIGISPIVIGLTVVAFGTSTPELAVSLDAALKGNADIAIANVVGSNIFNVLFILGVSAMISPLIVHSQMIRREIPIMIGVSGLIYLMALNGVVGRFEGLILFLGIIGYTTWLVIEAKKNKKENQEIKAESELEYKEKPSSSKSLISAILFVIVGLAVIMFGAEWLVSGAVQLAKSLGVSDTVIGLTIVAAGTSLPEVVASIMATIKGERDIAVGNVVGSGIYNILAILGLASVVVPSGLNVSESLLKYDFPIMILSALMCFVFFKTGGQLSRREGVFFLLSYVAYTAFIVQMATGGI